MKQSTLIVATRNSPLALWQARCVIESLQALHPETNFELLPMVAEGDTMQDVALQDWGGKALFVKTLEQALLEKRADIAVHSLKDMAACLDEPFALPAVLERADARDVWVSPQYANLADCPPESVIGTGSPRRQCQIKHFFPQLRCTLLRGNVQTRLKKIADGDCVGSVMAAAGLLRLDLQKHIAAYLDPQDFIPAIGQGAIGVECLQSREDMCQCLSAIDDADTRLCVTAERQLNQRLQGGCHLPIAAYACLHNDFVQMQAMVGDASGDCIRAQSVVGRAQCLGLGERLAEDLLEQGAADFLSRAKDKQ